MAENTNFMNWLRGLAGAIIGGVIGYFLTKWIASQGFYALVVPGALAGLGCGYLSGARSNAIGIACGVLGLVAGLATDWMLAPFAVDNSFGYYITHLHNLAPFVMLMIALGVYCGWSFGRGAGLLRRTVTRHREDDVETN